MADDEVNETHPHATPNQPYNADKPRPTWTPLLAVVGVLVLIVLIFAVITWARYHS